MSASKIERFLAKHLPWFEMFPVPVGIMYRNIEEKTSVLIDVGCGKGDVVDFLRKIDDHMKFRNCYFVGLDIWLPYLYKAKETFDDVIKCDANFIPIRENVADVVLSIDFIEHLKKSQAFNVLRQQENICRKTILILTPIGNTPKSKLEDNNPHQAHISCWYPLEFQLMGYKVLGVNGLRALRRENCKFLTGNTIATIFIAFAVILSEIFTYRLVKLAYHMLCTKRLHQE